MVAVAKIINTKEMVCWKFPEILCRVEKGNDDTCSGKEKVVITIFSRQCVIMTLLKEKKDALLFHYEKMALQISDNMTPKYVK